MLPFPALHSAVALFVLCSLGHASGAAAARLEPGEAPQQEKKQDQQDKSKREKGTRKKQGKQGGAKKEEGKRANNEEKSPTGKQQPAGSLFVNLSMDQAIEQAKAAERVVMVAWTDPKNSAALRLDQETWSNPQVIEWARKQTVPIQLDLNEHLEFSRRFGNVSAPSTYLVDPRDSSTIDVIPGFQAPDKFLALAEALLVGRTGTPVRPTGDAAQDPMAWLAWGNHIYATEREADDALHAYVWCLDHGEQYRAGFREHYFDFLVRRIRSLQLRAASANDMLLARRDALRNKIAYREATARDAFEYVRYNYWLRRNLESVETFCGLVNDDEKSVALRDAMFDELLDHLVGHRKYVEIVHHKGDILAYMRPRIARIQGQEGETQSGPPLTRATIIKEGCTYYEALLGAGRGKDAVELAQLLLAVKPNGRTYARLIGHAKRLELFQLARDLHDRGLEENPEGRAAKLIQRALAREETRATVTPGAVPPPRQEDKPDDDGE